MPHHTDPETLGETIRNSDVIDTDTPLKGTPRDVTVGDLWALFEDGTHRDMTVDTLDRRPAKPKRAEITVETFTDLQAIFDTLGVSAVKNTLNDGDEAFTVRYYFD